MGTIVPNGGIVLISLMYLMLAAALAASPDVRTGISVGPTATFVMPGIAVRADRALSPQVVLAAEVFGQSVGPAGKFGVRVAVDRVFEKPARMGLSGWFVGPRIGLWTLLESAGPTLGTDLQAIAGRRFVTGSRLFGTIGLGGNYRSVLFGDSSQGRRLLPTLEVRLGGAR